jgi:hypothetical protein
LGNQFKFGSIIKQINYEQSRESRQLAEANRRTRANLEQQNRLFQQYVFQKLESLTQKSGTIFKIKRNWEGLPEIPFGIIDPSQTRNLRIDERANSYEKITKEASGHLDSELSFRHSAAPGILGGIVGLLGVILNSEQEKGKRKKNTGNRGFSR